MNWCRWRTWQRRRRLPPTRRHIGQPISDQQSISGRQPATDRCLTDQDIVGLKYFDQLLPLLRRLHDDGCQRDEAGIRELHFDQYCLMGLVFLFHPICSSLRALQQAGELKNVQKKLGCGRAALGSLSESATVFDPGRLVGIIEELSGRLPSSRHGAGSHDERLKSLAGTLTLVDATLITVMPRIMTASVMSRRGQNGTVKWRLQAHFEVDRRHLLSHNQNGIEIQTCCAINRLPGPDPLDRPPANPADARDVLLPRDGLGHNRRVGSPSRETQTRRRTGREKNLIRPPRSITNFTIRAPSRCALENPQQIHPPQTPRFAPLEPPPNPIHGDPNMRDPHALQQEQPECRTVLRHVSRILKQLRWTPQIPVTRAIQRDEKEIERWRQEVWPDLLQRAARERRTLIVVDESGFYLLPSIIRTYAPRG